MTLLDTNVIVHYLKGDPGIVSRIRHASRGELAIPAIVVYELEYGMLRSKFPSRRRCELEEGLKHIQHVPFDSDAAMAAASIRVELEKRGMLIGPLDLLIAGTAVSRGAALVTNNAAEFSRIPGLRVMDWRSA
ncbi:MAG: type II toxin-antitoxin system VapC family toxin [Acidobacteriia bacterium]|nr:type II toxin-antitoxin system VapC family toxin [Terriglobia bacterium]